MTDTTTSTEATRPAEAKPAKALTAKEIAANKAAAVKERATLLAGFAPKGPETKSYSEQVREERQAQLDALLAETATALSQLTDGTDSPELEVAALKSLVTVGQRTRKAIADVPDGYFEDTAAAEPVYPADFA